jgi:hypothetical protein
MMRFRLADIPRPTFEEIMGVAMAVAYLITAA